MKKLLAYSFMLAIVGVASITASDEAPVPVDANERIEQNDLLLKKVAAGDVGTVRALLDDGADPNYFNEHNGRSSALHIAARHGHVSVAKALLKSGASVHARDSELKAPLHNAVDKPSYKMAKLLLCAKADPNAVEKDGETPLHTAAISNQKKIVDLLISYGALDTFKNDDGERPSDLAAEIGFNNVVPRLQSADSGTALLGRGRASSWHGSHGGESSSADLSRGRSRRVRSLEG